MGVKHVRSDAMPNDRSAIEGDGFTATVGRFDAPPPPGPGEGWHHHGSHDIVAYVLAGSVRVELGDEEGDAVVVEPGDLVHIEAGTVHREIYEGRMEIVGFSTGSGPGRIDVAGPSA